MSVCPPEIYQLLGRLGDICTLLPALREAALDTNNCPKLVVSAPFASLLDGVSYAKPVVWPHPFDRVNEARAFAQRLHRDHRYVDCTVYGHSFHRPSEMWSFDREVWHRSECKIPPGRLRLRFDRRSKEREEALCKQVLPADGKPFILAALSGTSSPFHGGRLLVDAFRKKYSDTHELVDISALRAERPYDLLGLFDRADGLIAIDSFPLHLAAASNVPTLALVTDGPTPWHTSSWRPHHTRRHYYSEATPANVGDILGAFMEQKVPTIHFATSASATPDASTARRLHLAHRSRKAEMEATGRWKTVEFSQTRDGTSVGAKPLPFVRDMIAAARAATSKPDDILCIANADIGFTAGITGLILMGCQRYGAVFAHRWDFHKVNEGSDVTAITEARVRRGRWYAGSDLFAFTVKWWDEHGHKFPDMLLAREGWDMILRNLIKSTKGSEIHQAIWHERHPSLWEQQPNLEGNNYNRRLAKNWLDTHGGHPNDWQVKPIYKS